ncbi:hypothetical protein ATANTOWER_011720 [Ataeniobius toweri]|uniref:Uncharacterized protein n=1 Tax=Ataeniobius toweri TaxID=208326 RepID=A0ABU7BS26_9TELE|nr:hypothetical protein [Ataeniobius toweri]
MSPPVVTHHWILALKIFILFLGFLLQYHICEASNSEKIKNMLFINANYTNASFPSIAIFKNESETQLCFNIQPKENNSGCCNNFICPIRQDSSLTSILTLNEMSLEKHDIVVLLNTSFNSSCMPSILYSSSSRPPVMDNSGERLPPSGFILNLHRCLRPGGKNIRLSKEGLCGTTFILEEEKCHGLTKINYDIQLKQPTSCKKTISCILPGQKPETNLTFDALNRSMNGAEAGAIIKDLAFKLSLMGNASTAEIKMGKVTGILEENDIVMDFAHSVYLPKEATKMAVENNGSFAGVLRFPDISEIDENRSLFKNEMLGIEMGANIFNLSKTIDIHFSNLNMTEFNTTCVSWDGNNYGTNVNWITDGCLTEKGNDSITCHCSHLTFFAILMSPFAIGNTNNNGNPNNTTGKISSSDLKSLTQITKAGCGMSMFFLGVALFMHFLIRKNKASQAVKILMNLFIALFVLNFCFLINESIADLKVMAACVAMAAVLHYSMLATFTWFFMQALHLHFNLYKIPTDMKHYMWKICSAGWVIPSVVVVGLLASNKYDYIEVSDDNGTSVAMCWIPDPIIHTGVNIGYYSIVFIFTLTIFIVTVVQITHFASKQTKTQENSSTKKRVFSLLGLFCLLGITWGFAFFSHGPLLLPSYYIFTILNSFQGFFLFVYYYFSSRIAVEDTKNPKSGST